MIHDIVKIPNAILSKPSAHVPVVDDAVRTLLDDMLETMYAASGIGLAAVQIGIAQRLVVIDVAGAEPREPLFLVNPEIVWSSEETNEHEEGCLSIPDATGAVTRPAEVTVRFLDREGKRREKHCDGLLATCVQHEIDHTNGILFIDRLSRLKRERIVKRFVKTRRDTIAA